MIDWSQSITAFDRETKRRADAREAIRARRDEAIRQGVIVSGIPIGADDITQSRLMGAAMAAMLDPSYSVQWKSAAGTFVTIGAQDVLGVAQAVRAHVQACFDREAALLADLSAGRGYALDEGWPVQSVRLANGAAIANRIGTGVYRVAVRGEWTADPLDGFDITLSQDGTALTVWVRQGASLSDIPEGQHITLREGV